MPRTADDSWDIATGVGATAVLVALARAAETASAEPLIRDRSPSRWYLLPNSRGVREQVAVWWALEPDEGSEDEAPDFTVDSQHMIDYQAVRGAASVAARRPVPVDLRHDWPQALRDAGFDGNPPTAWLAEGLLPFLPGAAQEATNCLVTATKA